MEYLAHIAADGREQSFEEHAAGTAELAARFAASFGAAEDARLAGWLHDVGKLSPGFQKRLHGGPPVDHSTAGAKEAFARQALSAAAAIAGHHSGLPDVGHPRDGSENTTLFGRVKHDPPVDRDALNALPVPSASRPEWLDQGNFLQNDFYTRMLFSALVDADFQDTQTFMEGAAAPRGIHATIPELLEKVRQKAADYLRYEPNAGDSQTNIAVMQQRNSVLRACMECGAARSPGLYTLTVPTGGGKTFSSLAFALEHAAANGKERVIYVIPYTSIIDQTVSVFSKLLREENVLAHYAGVDYQLAEPQDMTDAQYQKLLASENFDAPIVVTTAVAFFESIYSNRSSRCRKLHNLANSVLIFDEAQTLPPDYLRPCLSAITRLVQDYRSTAVLCTATQPTLEPIFASLGAPTPIQELCPDTGKLYQALKRTTIVPLGMTSPEALCTRLRTHDQALCVVNLRSTAQELFRALPPEGSYCLTTLLCAHDRRAQLDEIRDRLDKGLPCRVVSTSLIEAGVDVDFPTAYREECGLDSLLQTAGRTNRNGKRPAGESFVYSFRLEGRRSPVMMAKPISAAQFAARHNEDLASPEAIRFYFNELFRLKGPDALDTKQILPAIESGLSGCMLPFAQIAERFHLIETPTRPVYIPIDEGRALCERLRAGAVSRALMRRLGLFCVSCYTPHFQALDDAGALTVLPDGSAILNDLSKYDEKTGLALQVETGIGYCI